MEDLKKEINELESKIDQLEDASPEYLPANLRELRHRIFFIHTSLERSLEILIIKRICKPLNIPKGEARLEFNRSLLTLVGKHSFLRKLEILEDMYKAEVKLSSKKVREINKLRNEFAHPDAFSLMDYRDLEEKRKILTLLVETIEEFNKLFFT